MSKARKIKKIISAITLTSLGIVLGSSLSISNLPNSISKIEISNNNFKISFIILIFLWIYFIMVVRVGISSHYTFFYPISKDSRYLINVEVIIISSINLFMSLNFLVKVFIIPILPPFYVP